MTGNANLNKLNWNDGWGAVGFSTVVASAAVTRTKYVANKFERRKQIRWEKFDRAVKVKTAVDRKTISKQLGADMCVEIRVNPKFLENKAFEEISSDTKSAPSDSNKPPMASISFSNSNTMPYYKKKITPRFLNDITEHSYEYCYDSESQRPMEYAQVAEVGGPDSYGSGASIAEQRNGVFIWGTVFSITAILYLTILNKLKNTAWYHKNFGYDKSKKEWFQENFDRSYEKIEELGKNQKKILENQDEILELLKKNEFIKKNK